MDFSAEIPEAEWARKARVVRAAKRAGIPFAVGGGLAFSAYAGRWRDTKDLDLFILPADRDAMIQIVLDAGFGDMYSEQRYDPAWIFRAQHGSEIIDLIWAMANHLTQVDMEWLNAEEAITIHGDRMPLLPVEELLWSKLYVMQRERCDWPDLVNILFRQAGRMRWERLLERVGPDAPLLGSVMMLFSWLCPGCATELPAWIWERLGVMPPSAGAALEVHRGRVSLIDTRDWFGPTETE